MCLAISGQLKVLDKKAQFVRVKVTDGNCQVTNDLLTKDRLDVGNGMLIHVGFAMSTNSAEEAYSQLRHLTMLGEASEAIEEVEGYAFGEEDS